MHPDKIVLLNAQRLPVRLSSNEAAILLGIAEHDIPILIRSRLLKPAGNPTPNSQKVFAAATIQALFEDVEWVDKATKALAKHWKDQNDQKTRKHGANVFDRNQTAIAA
jgi:hypothetical protein